jgi:hypothetical protein
VAAAARPLSTAAAAPTATPVEAPADVPTNAPISTEATSVAPVAILRATSTTTMAAKNILNHIESCIISCERVCNEKLLTNYILSLSEVPKLLHSAYNISTSALSATNHVAD